MAAATEISAIEDAAALMSRLVRDRTAGQSLLPSMEMLARSDPELCACVLAELQREAPWPHEGFHRNEEIRQGLVTRMAALDVAPDPDCSLSWDEHVSSPIPDDVQARDFLDDLSIGEKQQWLMHLALHGPADESLVTRLMGLGESEPDSRAQNLALMAAARLLARSPASADATAGALLELLRLRGRTQGPGDLGYTVGIAGVLVSSRPRIAELLLAQYDPTEKEGREWALRVWSETDFRRIEPSQRRRIVDALIASSPQGEYRWLESSILSHIETLTGDVHPVVVEMMGAAEEIERVCGVRWASAAGIRKDEMFPVFVDLYRADTPAVQAMALQAIAANVGMRAAHGDATPLIPEMVESLHHADPAVRDAARAVLGDLWSQECRFPGKYEGLGTLDGTLLEQLRTADDGARPFLQEFARRQPAECLSGEIRREIQAP